MKEVLMSINPQYVSKIFDGTKTYEFRKTDFKNEVKRVYIYATHPVQKIVGYMMFDGILKENVKTLWKKCKKETGIGKTEFYNYLFDYENGYAHHINYAVEFKEPIDVTTLNDFITPQSWYYIKNESSIAKAVLDKFKEEEFKPLCEVVVWILDYI